MSNEQKPDVISNEFWQKLLHSNASVRNYFEQTIESAKIRGKSIPPTILICPNNVIREQFVVEVSKLFDNKQVMNFDLTTFKDAWFIGFALTQSQCSIVCLSNYSLQIEKKDNLEILRALKDVTINQSLYCKCGLGKDKRHEWIEIKDSFIIMILNKPSEITKGLRECFSTIVDISTLGELESDFRKFQIEKKLKEDYFNISEAALCKLSEYTFSGENNVESCVATIRDYMVVTGENRQIEIEDVNKAFQEKNVGNSNLSADNLDNIDPYEFEEYIASLFTKMGYETEHTGQSGDQGIDVIAERDTIRIGIQAKCYSGPVGNGAVQEVLSGVKFYNLDKGFVITNSYFTQSAYELAKASRVTLWDREKLDELINKYGAQ